MRIACLLQDTFCPGGAFVRGMLTYQAIVRHSCLRLPHWPCTSSTQILVWIISDWFCLITNHGVRKEAPSRERGVAVALLCRRILVGVVPDWLWVEELHSQCGNLGQLCHTLYQAVSLSSRWRTTYSKSHVSWKTYGNPLFGYCSVIASQRNKKGWILEVLQMT